MDDKNFMVESDTQPIDKPVIITAIEKEDVQTFLYNYFFVNDIPKGISYDISKDSLINELYIDRDKIVRCYRNNKTFNIENHYEKTKFGEIVSYITKNNLIIGNIKCECHQIFDLVDFISSLPQYSLAYEINKFNITPKYKIGDSISYIEMPFDSYLNTKGRIMFETLTGLSYEDKEKYIKNFIKSNALEQNSIITGVKLFVDKICDFSTKYVFTYSVDRNCNFVYEEYIWLNGDEIGHKKALEKCIDKIFNNFSNNS